MLFIIKNCEPNKYKDDKNKLLALSNLLKSHGERKNIVISNRETLEEILNSEIYGALEKYYANDILTNLRELGGIISHLEIHVVIDFSIESNDPIYDQNSKSITSGYSYFSDPDQASKPIFIAENESDFKFYLLVGNIFQRHTSKSGLSIGFNFSLGAGSHCKQQFDRFKNEGKIVVCVVDSDKSHPRKPEGSTSSAFNDEDRKIGGTSLARILQCREIENLIPMEIIETIVSEKIKDKIDSLDKIKKMQKTDISAKLFFDLKSGMAIDEMLSLDKKYGQFWKDILKKIPGENRYSCITDKASKKCSECNECPTISGICENLLDHTLDHLENVSSHFIHKNIEAPLRNEWNSLGKLISSWGCTLGQKVSRS